MIYIAQIDGRAACQVDDDDRYLAVEAATELLADLNIDPVAACDAYHRICDGRALDAADDTLADAWRLACDAADRALTSTWANPAADVFCALWAAKAPFSSL